jgi:hypothetical protein
MLMRSLPLAQSKDYHISAATLWLWAVAVFWLMLATFGIGAATGARTPLSLDAQVAHKLLPSAPHSRRLHSLRDQGCRWHVTFA